MRCFRFQKQSQGDERSLLWEGAADWGGWLPRCMTTQPSQTALRGRRQSWRQLQTRRTKAGPERQPGCTTAEGASSFISMMLLRSPFMLLQDSLRSAHSSAELMMCPYA